VGLAPGGGAVQEWESEGGAIAWARRAWHSGWFEPMGDAHPRRSRRVPPARCWHGPAPHALHRRAGARVRRGPRPRRALL